ncbi:MAG: tetratricopeptide repeat protein [Treponema sp.]|jgi:tetratricopeptide (TPR) repeat protein|nr:tetratricopeptide repeat protein [Treponema sp.]
MKKAFFTTIIPALAASLALFSCASQPSVAPARSITPASYAAPSVSGLLNLGNVQALRISEDSIDHLNRGKYLYAAGRFDEAIAELTQAIRLDPNLAEAYYNRGNAYHLKGDYDRAIADYEAALRIDPNHIARGSLLRARGR